MRAHGWVRDLPDNSPLYKKTGNAFNDNFIFATPGYNIRPLEMSGAIGSAQLTKWNSIMETRLVNKEHSSSPTTGQTYQLTLHNIDTSPSYSDQSTIARSIRPTSLASHTLPAASKHQF